MNQHETNSVAWALVFSHTGTILGQGFLADVQLKGRLLATQELEGVWLYGVNPGALAIGALTLANANDELRTTLTRVFIDFAEDAATFEDFKRSVERFFHEGDADSLREWEQAREDMRAGRVPLPDGLPRDTSDASPTVSVTRKAMEAVTPRDNPLVQQESGPALAAVA